eukprot:3992479-Prymnesium_polylepis.1
MEPSPSPRPSRAPSPPLWRTMARIRMWAYKRRASRPRRTACTRVADRLAWESRETTDDMSQ